MVLHPVGRRPAAVYWRRRLVLIVALLVVIFLIAKACSGGSTPPRHQGGGKPKVTPSTSTTPTAPCTKQDLTVKVTPSAASTPVGQKVELVAAVTDKLTTPCLLTVTPSQEIWDVSSAPVLVWTDQNCQASSAGISHKLMPGRTVDVSTITWDGHKSLAGKCGDGDVASAGTYHAQVKLGPIVSPEATFTLT